MGKKKMRNDGSEQSQLFPGGSWSPYRGATSYSIPRPKIGKQSGLEVFPDSPKPRTPPPTSLSVDFDPEKLPITYRDGKRWYGSYCSITSILAFLPNNWSVSKSELHEASVRGQYVHFGTTAELAERAHLPIPDFDIPEPLSKAQEEDVEIIMSYWVDFKKDMTRPDGELGIYPIFIEKAVANRRFNFAGRLDILTRLDSNCLKGCAMTDPRHYSLLSNPKDDDVWLIDIKTSRALMRTTINISKPLKVAAQNTGYYMALQDMGVKPLPNRSAVLRMSGQRGWEFKELKFDYITLAAAMQKYIERYPELRSRMPPRNVDGENWR